MILFALAALLLPARAGEVVKGPAPQAVLPELRAGLAPIPVLSALPLSAPSAGILESSLAAPQVPVLPASVAAPSAASSVAPEFAAPAARSPVEAQTAEGRARFDGASGWKKDSFESADGAAAIAVKRRDGPAEQPARVFSGGLALNESYEPLFALETPPASSQLFLWTRAHPPSGWTPTRTPIDADARDLARAILKAAEQPGNGKVELVLHSFGTLVFQRLVQLRGEPEVDAALAKLKGSRVVLLNATTHYEGSEKKAGPDFERMGMATRMFVDWLDVMDGYADMWRKSAELNPLLIPQVELMLAQWRAQRASLIASASREAAGMMKKDLAEPWPAFDEIRLGFLKDLERDARDPAWQEALLRRSSDMFKLEFSKADVRHIRRLGLRLDLVHSSRDQLLNWQSAKILCALLGIAAPDEVPAPGTVLSDRTGRFQMRIVDADHYFPLKRPGELAVVLNK